MNYRKINILTAFVFAAVLVLTGCSKDDGPISKRVQIEYVPAISTAADAGSTTTITLASQAAFQGKFTLSQYFPGTAAPTKVDIVVRKNASAANVKVFKADITTWPSSQTVTAAEIATLFGAALALNDTYDFAPNIYVGTRMYEAFPVTGTANGAGVVNMPGFSQWTRYTVR